MSDITDDLEDCEETEEAARAPSDLSAEDIADRNRRMIERQAIFRRAADTATSALIPFKEVESIAVYGTVAQPLRKEATRSHISMQARTALWHECHEIQLAVWLDRFNRLSEMRAAVVRALNLKPGKGHQVVFDEMSLALMEHGTDRYVGHLCGFQKCPADKPACAAPGCGAVSHLRQIRNFQFDFTDLDQDRCVALFQRSSNTIRRAADLPPPQDDG